MITEGKIGIASDHAGFYLKQEIAGHLKNKGYQVVDFGCYSADSVDYPDYAHPLARAVECGECSSGVAICATGNGINMTVNKYAGIRSAICWSEEITRLARAHNDANICSLPARFIQKEEAIRCIDLFFSTPFDGGRHTCRIDKIPRINGENT